MKIILLFDSNGVTIDNEKINILNPPKEIEKLLTNSLIIDQNNKVVGSMLTAENKIGTTLYYGNIDITNKNYNKFRIIDHRFRYKESSVNNNYNVINIVTIVKKVTN